MIIDLHILFIMSFVSLAIFSVLILKNKEFEVEL